MFGAAARIAARPAAAAAAAGVAANAAQGSAQARAPAQSAGRQAVHAPVHNNKLVDRDVDSGWLDVQLKDEVVLFQPFNTQELDQAADTVLALFGGAGPSTSASTSAGPILRRPGMQREVVLCMLEDTEVRELMMRQCSDLVSGGGWGGNDNLPKLTEGQVFVPSELRLRDALSEAIQFFRADFLTAQQRAGVLSGESCGAGGLVLCRGGDGRWAAVCGRVGVCGFSCRRGYCSVSGRPAVAWFHDSGDTATLAAAGIPNAACGNCSVSEQCFVESRQDQFLGAGAASSFLSVASCANAKTDGSVTDPVLSFLTFPRYPTLPVVSPRYPYLHLYLAAADTAPGDSVAVAVACYTDASLTEVDKYLVLQRIPTAADNYRCPSCKWFWSFEVRTPAAPSC
eukprot:XP_001694457.1 predicted protein [Chlamydomonas reinhardtii]